MQLSRVIDMKSADRRVRSRDVGGESRGIEYPGVRGKGSRGSCTPAQAKREVDHEVTDEHAISFRFDCTSIARIFRRPGAERAERARGGEPKTSARALWNWPAQIV
jgi:hypothetical protein